VRFIVEEGAADNTNNARASKQIVEMYHIPDDRMEVHHITDTSDTTIFFGDNNHYLAVCADDWKSRDGGCLHCTWSTPACQMLVMMGVVHTLKYLYNAVNGESYSILLGKLGDDITQPLVTRIGKNPEIFPPTPAMWFQPSFF
jgi:hypothetical protein